MAPRWLLRNSNTFHERLVVRWSWVGLAVTLFASTAQALDPNRAVSDYLRNRWEAQQGFSGGTVYAIAQTPDGYLWLGTENGLVRFDGLNFLPFNQTNSAVLPSGPVIDLLTDADGNLWIRPLSRDLLRYRDGQFQDVMPELDSARSGITAMCRGTNGQALFAVLSNGTFSYSNGRFSKLISSSGLPNILIISMAQTADGKIWTGTRDAGLFFISNGQRSPVPWDLPDRKINSLLAVENELWIGTDMGLVRWNGNEITRPGVPASFSNKQVLSMTSDREANIWVGMSNGMLRLNKAGLTSSESDTASLGDVNAIFEDREGNLWLGNRYGIERLRDTAFITYSASRDSSSTGGGIVYVDNESRHWFAPAEGGLYWKKGTEVGDVKNDKLDQDVVYAITGARGELWLGRRRGGLTHLIYRDGSFTTRTYTEADGLAGNRIYSVYLSRDGSVWAGSLGGGVSRLRNGKLTTFTIADGLGSNAVNSILETTDGTMQFATTDGLTTLSQGAWKTYKSANGLPPGSVNCLAEGAGGTLWIGTDYGIAFLDSDHIEVPRNLPAALHEPILGIAEDRNWGLWISTSRHILRVNRNRLLSGSLSESDVREFGIADGLLSIEGVKRDRSVIGDPRGRIWISTYRGVSVVDPTQVTNNLVPSLVHIAGVTVDGSSIDPKGLMRVPGGTQKITFSYAGLSLSVPERVRFRYKLDGFDTDWSEPVASREAVYTNLPPGPYRFHVIASNSAGLWNGLESSVQFQIEPKLWQTAWFRLAVLLTVLLITLALYRARLRRLTQQMNLRFEERLAERTRIAQDLHDTLLQGFLSASMQLHVAADQMPADAPGKPLVSRVLALMSKVIEEGRKTVSGLRSPVSSDDLEKSFAGVQQELAVQTERDFRVIVEGTPRKLHPVIRDEAYRIGREALVNAARHSQATKIEVELEYSARELRIIVRDNGKGIDSQVLRVGKDGHWGLAGMRERADAIGARLKVWSRTGAGTEVELVIPGRIAFDGDRTSRRLTWLDRFFGRKNQNGYRGKDERPD
jgi:signal transduction histidine kinase/ligand-binding sensor domain-containing protein